MKSYIFKILFFPLILTFFVASIFSTNIILKKQIPVIKIPLESSISDSNEPAINARHAIIFDRNSKKAIYGKKETEICKMASTTKIMTAIVVIENSDLNKVVEISSKSSGTGGSRLGLSKKDSISVEHLLYGLMLRSGNDAAVALAESTAGSIENFSLMMNKKAKELNLSNTNFVTPHGLDNDNHYTTALDLAKITDYALENKVFSKIVNTKTYTILINNKPKTISNTNELLGNYEGIYGVKTGFTNGANRCLVTSCRRNNLNFICIVLGCDTKKDRTKDSIALLNYAFNNFSLVNTKEFTQRKFDEWLIIHKNSFFINKGIAQYLDLYLDEHDIPFSNIAINNSFKDNINVEISFNSYLEAPLERNSQIGSLKLFINNEIYYNIKIMNKNKIEKKTFSYYMINTLKNYFFIINNCVGEYVM